MDRAMYPQKRRLLNSICDNLCTNATNLNRGIPRLWESYLNASAMVAMLTWSVRLHFLQIHIAEFENYF